MASSTPTTATCLAASGPRRRQRDTTARHVRCDRPPASAGGGRASGSDPGDPRRAGHAGAAEAAVAARVLGEVLLVVVLGVVEGPNLGDLGADLAVAGLAERSLEAVPCRLGGGQLLVGRRVDGRAVLGADRS